MQKKLIALAVAGLASTGALAQSNVTIYGLLQPSYDFISIDGSPDVDNMAYNNSRLGFKGEENIGNGLKALFQCETKADIVDRGADNDGLCDRDSFVGLSSAAGTVTFGNHQTAYKKVADFADPFADTIGDYNNIMAVVTDPGATPTTPGFFEANDRIRKSVYYNTPNFGGFTGAVSFAMSDVNDGPGSKSNDTISIGGNYVAGGLTLMAGYENMDVPGAGNDELVSWKVGAGYKFGTGTRVAAIFENMSFDTTNLDTDRWFLSVSHPITGNIDLNASYADAGETSGAANDGGSAWALGVDYKFSKRTSIQGVYAAISNDAGGQYFMDSGYAGGPGDDVDGFSVRLRHSF